MEHGIELADNSDCDLLVAFAQGERTHVVLLEAKGFMPFSVPVLKHKADRLRAIFGAAGNRFLQAVPHWVFVGPKPPPYVEVPEWMVDPATGKLRYLALPQPASHKFAVVRCDEHGHKKDAGYWKIRSNPWPGLPEQEADSLT